MKKILLLICILLGLLGCSGCRHILNDTINVTNGSKFIVLSVEKRSKVYQYKLNSNIESDRVFIWDVYGYSSVDKYNVGDTLIVRIERYKE